MCGLQQDSKGVYRVKRIYWEIRAVGRTQTKQSSDEDKERTNNHKENRVRETVKVKEMNEVGHSYSKLNRVDQ